jgi:hypothetical protein
MTDEIVAISASRRVIVERMKVPGVIVVPGRP